MSVLALPSQITGGKGGSSSTKQPTVAENSTPSLATARIVYIWSWGPIVGPVNGDQSVMLEGTPLVNADGTENYPGVKWQFRNGELDQLRLDGIAESTNEIDVNQTLLTTAPWIYTVTNPVLDAVRVRFGWPTLQSQDSSGNINGVRIEYAIDVATDGGAYVQVLSSFVDRKNVTNYERSHRIDLPAGSRWTIRARRLTAEANSSLVADSMVVEAVAEIVDSDQEYPLTAVGCVEYDAQQFGGDIAKIAVRMRGRIISVPANYDPENRIYSTTGTGTTNGVWDGTFKQEYTNNPAWIFYDLVLNPYYGLGDRIDATMIDRWNLYRIGQYCDQMVSDGNGGQEPRYACNIYLQKQADGYAVLQDLASVFHGMSTWDGSQITVNADMPGDPVYTYNPSQILNYGEINYAGTRARDRHNLAMVTWDNPAQAYDTDKEPVFDDEALAETGAINQLDVPAYGCTSRGQAQRAGQYALITEQTQTRGATFRVGLDGGIPKPGEIIAVADPMLVGRINGGRVSAVAGQVITLDREITIPTTASLWVNLPSGTTESRVITAVDGRKVTVQSAFSETPETQAGWVLEFDDLNTLQFLVRNVTRPEWHQYELEVIQHEPSKFDTIDYGAVLDDRPISALPIGIQDAPAEVLISEYVVIEQGIAVTVMTIAWTAAPGAVAYDIEWRWGSREWVQVPRTGELSVDVRGIYAGDYIARVRAVNALKTSSLPTSSALTTLNGKVGAPPVLAYLRTTSEIFAIRVEWGMPEGAEDTAYTELQMASESTGQDPLSLGLFGYPTNLYVHSGMAAGVVRYFRARLVDKTGNVGDWSEWVYGVSSADANAILDYITGQITDTQLGQDLLSEIEKISGDGAGSVNERLTEGDKALQAQLDSLQSQLSDLAGAPDWDSAQAYLSGSLVKDDGKLYRATQDVPAGTPLTDTSYWESLGDYASLGDLVTALAVRVDSVETSVQEIDGELQAMATRVVGVEAQVFPLMAGDTDWQAGDSGVDATAYTVYSAFSDADSAISKRIDVVEAQVGDDLNARFEQEIEARVTADEALTSQITTVSARFDDAEAALQQEITARATADQAFTESVTTLQSQLGDTTALVSDTSQAVVDLEGNVNASRVIKVGVDSNGQYYAAGMGIGVENTDDGIQSVVTFLADRFAVMSQVNGTPQSMFAIENGQTVIRSAFISQAQIQELIVSGELRSANYVAGSQGIRINFVTGEFEINGVVSGQGRMNITNQLVQVFDANSVLRVRMGIW